MTIIDTYYPFNTGLGAGATVTRWRAMARQFTGSGIISGYGTTMCKGSVSGSVVTVQPGAMWIDGFYGEITAAKTLSISGNGTVVARMDPSASNIALYYVTTVTQTPNSNGIYEIPILRVASGVGTDVRQYATTGAPHSGAVVAETLRGPAAIGFSSGSTAWTAFWSAISFPKYRPDTLLDFFYTGSSWGGVGGAILIGVTIATPNASAEGVMCRFFYNTAGIHMSMAGGIAGWGQELVNAGYVGNCTCNVNVQNLAANAPLFHTDGNDYHTLRIVERMP